MDYSKTVLLPQPLLPMKADLSKREPEIIQFWEKNQIYLKMLEMQKGKRKYILHDGPPYANGHIHMGHALNKILKDLIVKFKSLTGHYAPYLPGWDCHGLPIEHQLMQELKKDKHSIDQLEFRKKAAEFAMKFVEIQKKEFVRLGIFGDWENPYLTLARDYEETILRTFRALVEKNFIYRKLKPVLWCPHCETALAEAEVEYEEKESDSIYLLFDEAQHSNEMALVWTTTPWTLPANVAIAFHPDENYVAFVSNKLGNKKIWVAEKRLNYLSEILGEGKVVELAKGSQLRGRLFLSPVRECDVPALTDRFVSMEDGTGIVHIAPGHGDIDYVAGHILNHLPILSPVEDTGKFNDEVENPELKGLFVLSQGNEKVLEILKEKNLLVHQEKIRHFYPHCWRCKNPVIFRATHQWFLSVDQEKLRERLLAEIENVQWVPDYGKNRIKSMIEQRPDWCISRQRLWGTPIPIFYCADCGQPLLEPQALNMVEEAIGLDGSDIWFKEEPEYFLKNLKPFQCKCGNKKFVKETDILDVWFDSGVSHEAVLKGERKSLTGEIWKEALAWPADLYLEGSDQHRGWFQVSLIPSIALHNKAPYKSVLTHGFIVDGEGKKMSKSQGNVIAPEEVLKNYGADILRLWVAAQDFREDIRISPDILKGIAENYKKIRNTFRFLIGNLYDFNFKTDQQPIAKMLAVDRWALSELFEFTENCKKDYEEFEFHRVIARGVEFCAVDCSSFYFDMLKDRLYTFKRDFSERKSAQTVLYFILSYLLKIFSPILSFTCEEVWQIGKAGGHWQEESVFLSSFPQPPEEWQDKKLKEDWEEILAVREKVYLSLESARKAGRIGSSLDAKVILAGGNDRQKKVLKSLARELPSIFIVSQVEIDSGNESVNVRVEKASGEKCLRCWRYDETVNKNGNHPGLCSRCIGMLS